MTEYMLCYRVWSDHSPTLLSANHKAPTIEGLKAFAKEKGVQRGSIMKLAPNQNGVQVVTYVGPLK